MMTPTMKSVMAAPILALLFQSSFSTAQNANLRKSFTVASEVGVPRFPTASLPTCGTNNKGATALDSTTNTFKYCNGTSWIESAGGGGGASAGIQGAATGSLPACAAGTTNLVVFDTTLGQLLRCDGSAYVANVGTTVICTTAVAVTTTGTSIETVATCSIPAGFLAADGQSLSFDAGGSCAANANSKTVTMVLGTSTIGTAYTSTGCNNTTFTLRGDVVRRSATTQALGWNYTGTGNAGVGSYSAGTETLSGAVSVLLRFTTPVASGDMTMQYFRVTSNR